MNQAGDDWVRYPFGPGQPRYLCAKAKKPQGEVIVTVFVFNGGDPYAVVDVVEPKGMTNKMVDPDAGTMAKRIAASGHVELYGIYFDVDKATIQPESGATLEQVAALLKSDASLKLSVVGHTDNAGTAAHNQQLSEARAKAVVNELTTKYGIAAARLQAVGKGSSAPVASNTTEAGRAKNRRVELVKR